MNKNLLLVAILSMLVIPISGLGHVNTVNGQAKVVFRVGSTPNMGFNPLTGQNYLFYSGILFTPLYCYNTTYGTEPWAAESSTLINSTTLEIKLKDFSWTDGHPVTAEDYKFSWDLMLNYPTSQSRFLEGITNIEVVDSKTFLVTLASPCAGHLAFLTGPCVPVPKHIWEPMGLTNESALSYDNIPPVGFGPFKYVDYSPGEYVDFLANDNFFAGRPKIDELIFKIYADRNTMMAAYEAGEIDATDEVPTVAIARFASDTTNRLYQYTDSGYYSIYTNQYPQPKDGNPALDDLTVRKAIAMCIDKGFITSQLVSQPQSLTPIAEFWPEYDESVEALWPKFDTNASAALLESAGYNDTNGDGIREDPVTHQPLAFRMIFYNEISEGGRIIDALKGSMNQAGMDLIDIRAMGYELWDICTAAPYNWDLMIWNWNVHDPISCWYPYTTAAIDTAWSSSGLHDPVYDGLYATLLASTTDAQYMAAQHALQAYYVANVTEPNLYHGGATAMWKTSWTGFVLEPGCFNLYGLNVKAFLYVEPVSSNPPPASAPAVPLEVIVGAIVAAVVVIGIAAWWALRRRKRAPTK